MSKFEPTSDHSPLQTPPTGPLRWIATRIWTLCVFVVGIVVLLLGIVMIVTPGPAMLFIPAGLAILATEFLWARRWLNSLKERSAQLARRVSAGAGRRANHRHGSESPGERSTATSSPPLGTTQAGDT